MNQRLQWFYDHVGKRVWRNNLFKPDYFDVSNHYGLLISDKQHAMYLHDVETEFTKDGDILRYFSTKEERDDFELKLKEQ